MPLYPACTSKSTSSRFSVRPVGIRQQPCFLRRLGQPRKGDLNLFGLYVIAPCAIDDRTLGASGFLKSLGNDLPLLVEEGELSVSKL
jgi:hypothetical protein